MSIAQLDQHHPQQPGCGCSATHERNVGLKGQISVADRLQPLLYPIAGPNQISEGLCCCALRIFADVQVVPPVNVGHGGDGKRFAFEHRLHLIDHGIVDRTDVVNRDANAPTFLSSDVPPLMCRTLLDEVQHRLMECREACNQCGYIGAIAHRSVPRLHCS